MRPTLILINHHEIAGRQFHHGDELPPGFLSQDAIDKMIDLGWLKEYQASERRSLYRLFSEFSGCNESEPLSGEELTAHGLRE